MPLANPWSHSRTEPETGDTPNVAVQQVNAYAAPPLNAGDAYMDEFGWAPQLAQRTSAVETPSAQRLQTIPRRDYRPDPVRPPEEFWGRISADDARRESVTDTTAVGWTIPKGILPSDRRFAPNPRSTPPPEPRLTQQLGQNTWSFTRPFDQFNRTYDGDPPTGSARRFNGMHFSMADHRRNYEILTMSPARSRRNTYRMEPAPWDIDIVDLPPQTVTNPVDGQIRSGDVGYPSRSQRLM